MKIFLKLFIVFFAFTFAGSNSLASPSSSSGGNAVTQTLFNSDNPLKDNIVTDMANSLSQSITPESIVGYANTMPVYSAVFPESLAAFLCDFRRLFCGKLSIVMIAVAIFISGLLILNNRMNWTWGIVIVTAGITLLNAEDVTSYILGNTFNIPLLGGVNDALNSVIAFMPEICMCFPTLEGIGGDPCVAVINGAPNPC